MITLEFLMVIEDDSLTISQLEQIVELAKGVGEVRWNGPRGIFVSMDVDGDMWEAAREYYSLKEEVDAAAGHGAMSFPDRPITHEGR